MRLSSLAISFSLASNWPALAIVQRRHVQRRLRGKTRYACKTSASGVEVIPVSGKELDKHLKDEDNFEAHEYTAPSTSSASEVCGACTACEGCSERTTASFGGDCLAYTRPRTAKDESDLLESDGGMIVAAATCMADTLPENYVRMGGCALLFPPVCHFDDGSGDYRPVELGDPNYDAYVAAGDKGPGEAVPGDHEAYVEFGSSCEQVIMSCHSGGFIPYGTPPDFIRDQPIRGKRFVFGNDLECNNLDDRNWALFFDSGTLLDCEGHKLKHTGSCSFCSGINVFGDVTLENCVVEGFPGWGIDITEGSAALKNITASGNGYGIEVKGNANLLGVTVIGKSTYSYGYGIYFGGNATLTNITVSENGGYGLWLYGSSNRFDSVVSCSNGKDDLRLGHSFNRDLVTGDPTCGTCDYYGTADCTGLCSLDECPKAV